MKPVAPVSAISRPVTPHLPVPLVAVPRTGAEARDQPRRQGEASERDRPGRPKQGDEGDPGQGALQDEDAGHHLRHRGAVHRGHLIEMAAMRLPDRLAAPQPPQQRQRRVGDGIERQDQGGGEPALGG